MNLISVRRTLLAHPFSSVRRTLLAHPFAVLAALSFFISYTNVNAEPSTETEAKTESYCSYGLDSTTPVDLKNFLNKLNPFWGTWRGDYKGDPIVGELYLDKQNKFNVRGTYKTHNVKDQKVKLCYQNKKFKASAYGFTVNINVINSRKLEAKHFLIDGTITVQR